MGQVSLPRLEKLNVSMSWESAIFFEKECWAAPKLYVFYNIFTKYLFYKRLRIAKKQWLFAVKKQRVNFMVKLLPNKLRRLKPMVKANNNKLQCLGRYLYHKGGKYTTLVLYSTQRESRFLYKEILHKHQKVKWVNVTK